MTRVGEDNRRGRVRGRGERGTAEIHVEATKSEPTRWDRRTEGGEEVGEDEPTRRSRRAVRSHGSAATGKQTSEPPRRGHAYSCACVCVHARVIVAADRRRGTLAPSRPSIITRGAREGRRWARGKEGETRVCRRWTRLSCGPVAPLRVCIVSVHVHACLRVKREREREEFCNRGV